MENGLKWVPMGLVRPLYIGPPLGQSYSLTFEHRVAGPVR